VSLPLTASVSELAEVLGPLPPGDTPAAWWYSTSPKVVEAYQLWEKDHRSWRNRIAKLYKISGFPHPYKSRKYKRGNEIRIAGIASDHLVGLYPPPGMGDPPRWWRLDRTGILVPRRYTVAEKNSEVSKLFKQCQQIPIPAKYCPGIPATLWIPSPTPGGPTHAFPVQLRRPGEAVLAFVGWPPAGATPPFEPDPELWEPLKLSTWHLLRERQSVMAGST
jgi:hypothetical protein